MRIFFFVFLLSSWSINLAQSKYAISVGTGTAYYFGDLSESPANAYWRPAGQIAFSYQLQSRLSLRLGIHRGTIGADDRKANDITRQERALHFQSRITDFNFMGVFELRKQKSSEDEDFHPFFTPYISGGISLLTFNPQGEYEGLWYDLKSLGTEGQSTANINRPGPTHYNVVQPTIPLGLGISYKLAQRLAINFELGYRFTFTDHLDDVGGYYPNQEIQSARNGAIAAHFSDPSGLNFPEGAPRGNVNNRDSYLFGTVSVTFFLKD